MTIVTPDQGVLDNPIWHSLTGAHAHLAEVHGLAARYRDDVAQFHALADPGNPRAWAGLAELTGPGAEVAVSGSPAATHPGWCGRWRTASASAGRRRSCTRRRPTRRRSGSTSRSGSGCAGELPSGAIAGSHEASMTLATKVPWAVPAVAVMVATPGARATRPPGVTSTTAGRLLA